MISKKRFKMAPPDSTVRKVHKQFGHKPPDKLISLLKSAGTIDTKVPSIVKDICSNCAICHKLKRPPAKPIVALAHANDFNQIVAMDLHEIDHNFYYLHAWFFLIHFP